MATASRGHVGTRARRLRGTVAEIAEAFAEHNLLTYASAIAFQGLVALVPLTLLWLGILGAIGHKQVWTQHVAPAIEKRLTKPVFHGIDDTVLRILDHGTAGLIAVSTLLSLWYLTAAMRPVIEALNQIHDVEDERLWWNRLGVAVGLGAAAGVGLFGAALVVIGGPRGVPLGVLRWAGAILLLAMVLTLVVRFAPAQRPRTSWATLGAALVVASWIVASLLFRLWVSYVANFKTPVGTLTTLLVLTSYLFVTVTVFLAGVQFDELLRKQRSRSR
jgi:membrane protein